MIIAWLLFTALIDCTYSTRVNYKTDCSQDGMNIYVEESPHIYSVELDKWSIVDGCTGRFINSYIYFNLPITGGRLSCGVTTTKNTISGDILYTHKIVVTTAESKIERIPVKCSHKAERNATLSNLVKRDVLPPEFVEPDYIEITSEVSATAPVPILGVGVRQNGALVDGQINVLPGTPLTMEVFLDDDSSSIYGILVSYMEVTDTNNKQETIVYNGCTVDSYLFENFITESGDYLTAKFRAFKFPDSNYVFFQGTVDVCLDKCNGIQCSNGQLGFGRKRRSVSDNGKDPNKIFEVTMETFIKFEETVQIPEYNIQSNKRDRGDNLESNQPFYDDFFLRRPVRLEEAPLLEREPPSIVFTGGAGGMICQALLPWLIMSLLFVLRQV